MDADEAARRIIAALESRPRHYSFPKRLSLVLGLSKLVPSLWQKAVATDSKKSTSQQPGN